MNLNDDKEITEDILNKDSQLWKELSEAEHDWEVIPNKENKELYEKLYHKFYIENDFIRKYYGELYYG